MELTKNQNMEYVLRCCGGKGEEGERDRETNSQISLKIHGWALLKREMTIHKFLQKLPNDSDRRTETILCSEELALPCSILLWASSSEFPTSLHQFLARFWHTPLKVEWV